MKNMKTLKKVMIILISVAAAITIVLILLFNFVFAKPAFSLKPDDYSGSGFSRMTYFNNGIFAAINPQSNCLEIFENGSKKTLPLDKFPYSLYPMYDGKNIYLTNEKGINFYDFNGDEIGKITVDEAIVAFDRDDNYYYLFGGENIYRCNAADYSYEVIFTADDFVINHGFVEGDYLYIEYINTDQMISTILEYDMQKSKLLQKYEVDVSQENIKYYRGYSVSKGKNNFYYNFNVINNDIIYRYDVTNSSMEFIGGFFDTNICGDKLYYFSTAGDYDTDGEDWDRIGYWQLDLDSLKTVFITDKKESYTVCTENYLYIYNESYIGFKNDSPFPDCYLDLGYALDQIPVPKD